jgi:hypothetical protein
MNGLKIINLHFTMLMWDVKHIILQNQKDEYVKLSFFFLFLLFHLLYQELT